MSNLDPTPQGELRYSPPTKDDLNLGLLCHLLGIFTSFIGPLVIWSFKKDSNPYIEAQAREAMNFQITALLATFCCVFGFCAAPILIAMVQITRITLSIVATVKAGNGEMYRYPVTFRFIR